MYKFLRCAVIFLIALFVIPLTIAIMCGCSKYGDVYADILPTMATTEDNTVNVPETEPECTTVPVMTSIPTEPVYIPSETVEAPEPTEPIMEIDPHGLELLACVIYQEAGGDRVCDECRRRVADVVLNRVSDPRFPNTIEDVLTAKGQYGNYSKTGVVWSKQSTYAGEQHAVERAYRIAGEVLSGNHSDLYGEGYVWQATFKQGKDNIYHCGHYYGR